MSLLNEIIKDKMVSKNIVLIKNKEKSDTMGGGSDYDYWFDIYKNNENVGSISLINRGDVYQVSNVIVSQQGHGIGLSVYLLLIDSLDKRLRSDSSRTDSANKLWQKLVRIGKAEFNNNDNKYYSI